MIDLKQLAASISNLTLKEIRNLQEELYREYGLEVNIETNTWQVRRLIDKEKGIIND